MSTGAGPLMKTIRFEEKNYEVLIYENDHGSISEHHLVFLTTVAGVRFEHCIWSDLEVPFPKVQSFSSDRGANFNINLSLVLRWAYKLL